MTKTIRLKEVYCWQRGDGYATFIQESQPLEFPLLANLQDGETCQYVYNGPYRIKICMQKNPGENTAALMVGPETVEGFTDPDGHGERFVFFPNVEKMGFVNGKHQVLGSAEGCFKVTW